MFFLRLTVTICSCWFKMSSRHCKNHKNSKLQISRILFRMFILWNSLYVEKKLLLVSFLFLFFLLAFFVFVLLVCFCFLLFFLFFFFLLIF